MIFLFSIIRHTGLSNVKKCLYTVNKKDTSSQTHAESRRLEHTFRPTPVKGKGPLFFFFLEGKCAFYIKRSKEMDGWMDFRCFSFPLHDKKNKTFSDYFKRNGSLRHNYFFSVP